MGFLSGGYFTRIRQKLVAVRLQNQIKMLRPVCHCHGHTRHSAAMNVRYSAALERMVISLFFPAMQFSFFMFLQYPKFLKYGTGHFLPTNYQHVQNLAIFTHVLTTCPNFLKFCP